MHSEGHQVGLRKKGVLELSEKRDIAAEWVGLGFRATRVLRVVGLAHSSFYAKPTEPASERLVRRGRKPLGFSLTELGAKVCDEQIKEFISELIAGEGECYGYRKIRAMLCKDHRLVISVRKVYRLCKELDILRDRAPRRNLDPVAIAINRTVTRSNQLWEMDIKYGFIEGEQRFFYVMSLIDVMDRSIVDFHVGLSCLASDAAAVLKGAMMKRQLYQVERPPVIRTDNGPQFLALCFAAACAELGIHHERIPFKTPNKNAHIESFHASLQRECLGRHEFDSFRDAHEVVCRYMRHYTERRPHGSLRMLSPSEAYARLAQGSLAVKAVTL